MNLSQLYYFSKLVEVKSYGQAARELYITQPSLSHAIKSLEKELGVALFERDGRRMKLTAFGSEFVEYINRALSEIDKAVELAHGYNGRISGSINVGAVYPVQGDYLPTLLREYREQYGSLVKFNLFQGFTDALIKGLENGKYDVVFAAKMPNKPDLVFEHVISHELVAFMNRNHPLASRERIALEDLAGETIYTYRRGTTIGEEVNDVLEAYGLAAVQEFEDEITLGGMVEADSSVVGLATLTKGLKSFEDIAIKSIQNISPDFHRIYLAYKRDIHRSRIVESFIEFTGDYIPPYGVVPSTDRGVVHRPLEGGYSADGAGEESRSADDVGEESRESQ